MDKKDELDIYAYIDQLDKRDRFVLFGKLMARFAVVYDTIVRRTQMRTWKDYEVDIIRDVINL